MTDDAVLAWLLDTDPALRWQVQRDLAGEPEAVWRATRARAAAEGMGARLIALQHDDGQWAGGAFFPAGFDFDGPEAAPGAGQPWTATTWVLNDLREWGVDPDALRVPDTAGALARNARWEYDDLPYWGGEVDVCINGWTIANGAWLGADVSGLADWFVAHRLADGGWNCEWVEGSTRSSFHSTLNALVSVLEYERRTGGSPDLRAARRAAQEYLLERALVRRASTGEDVGPFVDRFHYPSRHAYSALRALDHFRQASVLDGTAPDPRLAEAVARVRAARQPDGRWLQQHRLPGRTWFDVDVPVGEPSPWVTFQALRVLAWWEAAHAGDAAPGSMAP